MTTRPPVTTQDRARALVAQMSTCRAEIASTRTLVATVEALLSASTEGMLGIAGNVQAMRSIAETLNATRQTLDSVDLTLDVAVENLTPQPEDPGGG